MEKTEDIFWLIRSVYEFQFGIDATPTEVKGTIRAPNLSSFLAILIHMRKHILRCCESVACNCLYGHNFANANRSTDSCEESKN